MERIMNQLCTFCGKESKRTVGRYDAIACEACYQSIVFIFNQMELDLYRTQLIMDGYFDEMTESEREVAEKVEQAYKTTEIIMLATQRKSAFETLDKKIERTIQSKTGTALADYLEVWAKFRVLKKKFDDAMFYSVTFRNSELDEWVREYEKRKNRH